jgi:hypothetical protein
MSGQRCQEILVIKSQTNYALQKEKITPGNGESSADQVRVFVRGNGRKAFLQVSSHTTSRKLMKILQAKRLVQGGRQLEGGATLVDGAVIDCLGRMHGGMEVCCHRQCVCLACRLRFLTILPHSARFPFWL